MARRLGGLAALAAGVVVASLVIAQVVSGRNGDRGQLIALFVMLLVAVFGLLAAAVVDSEHGVEQISATPHWSLRAAVRRLVRRILGAIGRVVRGGAAIVWAGLTAVVRLPGAGLERVRNALRPALTPERRAATRDDLGRRWRAALVALGLPPDDEAAAGLDDMPTLGRTRSSRVREAARRPSRPLTAPSKVRRERQRPERALAHRR